jgi:hypothetical protein
MELRFNRRHLVRPLSVVTITALGASLAVGWPHWLPVRSDRSLIVRITSKRIAGLYPGARRELIVTFHNTTGRHATIVRNLRIDGAASTNRRCAASRRNLRIHQYRGKPIWLRPNGRRKVVLLLTMPNTVADACQRATFTIHYRAETWVPRR